MDQPLASPKSGESVDHEETSGGTTLKRGDVATKEGNFFASWSFCQDIYTY